MKTKISIFIAVLMMAAVSCENNITIDTDDIELRVVNIAGPLGKLHFNLWEDLIKDLDLDSDEFVIAPNDKGVICFIYKLPPELLEWGDKIQINDYDPTTFSYDFSELNWKEFIELNIGQTNLRIPDELIPENPKYWIDVMQTSEEEDSYMSKAEFSGGTLRISVVIPDVISDIEINISIPKLTNKTNHVGGFTEKLLKSSSNPQNSISELSIDLNGYYLDTEEDNKVMMEVEFTNAYLFLATPNTELDKFDITASIMDMEFYLLRGYFGQIKFEDEEIDPMEFDLIELFDEDLGIEIDGNFTIRNIELTMDITSIGVGVPVEVKSVVEFTDQNDNNALPFADIVFEIPAAVDPEQTVTTTEKVTRDLVLNKDMSKLHFNFEGLTNPNGNIPPGSNFIGSDGSATVDITVTVPFHFILPSFKYTDMFDFDYKDFIENDEKLHKSIEHFYLWYEIDNSLPFEIELMLYAVADPDDDVAKGVEIGKINVGAGNQPRDRIGVNKTAFNGFWDKDVKYIVVEGTAKTIGNGWPVTIDSYLDIFISVDIKSGIPFSF